MPLWFRIAVSPSTWLALTTAALVLFL